MALGKAMSLRDFAKYVKRLGDTAKPTIVKGIHSGVARAVVIAQESTMTAPPASANGSVGAFNTGAFRGAWRYSVHGAGGRVYNTSPYGPYIEDGRRKGAKIPPIREIELWARRKLGLSAAEAKRAAFPIARAIAKRGLRPRHVLKRATPKIVRIVMTEVRTEIHAWLKGGRL